VTIVNRQQIPKAWRGQLEEEVAEDGEIMVLDLRIWEPLEKG